MEKLPDISSHPVIVEFRRGGLIESIHRAHVCVVDNLGHLRYCFGDPQYVTFMRSSSKPIQSMMVILSGASQRYRLTLKEFAVIAGSHSGEPIHTDIVTELLAKAGLTPDALQCGTHPPYDAKTRTYLRSKNLKPTPLHHNCSGKHAGMLLTAVHLGESTETYLDPYHPIQIAITNLIGRMADFPADSIDIGIDGCSAPVHALPMRNAALAFVNLIDPTDLIDDETKAVVYAVSNAMWAYPEMVAGTDNRICTELMTAGRVYGLIAKAGAEGYYAASWRDIDTGGSFGMTVKVEDGAQRARDPLVVALLQKFGVLPSELPDTLKPFSAGVIKNFAGIEVGEVVVRLDHH